MLIVFLIIGDARWICILFWVSNFIKYYWTITRGLGWDFRAITVVSCKKILKLLMRLLSLHPIRYHSGGLLNLTFLTTQCLSPRWVGRNHCSLSYWLQNCSLDILLRHHFIHHKLWWIIWRLKLFWHLPLYLLYAFNCFDSALMVLHQFSALHKGVISVCVLTWFINICILHLTRDSDLILRFLELPMDFEWLPQAVRHSKKSFILDLC